MFIQLCSKHVCQFIVKLWLYNNCLKFITSLQSSKYSWSKILYGEKMADCASGDALEQPEGIFQLIDKLESIVDQIVQE